MAFVFRSQKCSIFNQQNIQVLNQKQGNNDAYCRINSDNYNAQIFQAKKNSLSQKKVLKGLPSLLRKNLLQQVEHLQNKQLNKCKQNNKNNQEKQENDNNMCLATTKRQLNKKNLVNYQKLKQNKQNYYFSSKLQRQPYGPQFKQLQKNNKNQPFHPQSQNLQKEINKNYKQKHQQIMNIRNKNKNLLQTANQLNHIFKKASIQISQPINEAIDNLLICCKKQQKDQIRRKSSPNKNVNFKNICKIKNNHINNHCINNILNQYQKNSNSCNNLNRPSQMSKVLQKSQNKQNLQIIKNNKHNLKPSNQYFKPLILKKICKLKKGPLNSSFYRENYDEQSSNESQQNQRYQYNDSPGPGSYDNVFNPKQKKSFRSKKDKFAKIFVSPLQRFSNDQVKYNQISYVNQDNAYMNNSISQSLNKKKNQNKSNQSFLSKSPKFKTFEKKVQSPPPGFYNVRQSIQHDIVKNLLKSANTIFCSSVQRFADLNSNSLKNNIPGPGAYDLSQIQKQKRQEQRNQLSFSYKSEVKRNLSSINNDKDNNQYKLSKEKSDRIKQNNQYSGKDNFQNFEQDKNSIIDHGIHYKQQNFESSQFFTAPPFMSSVQRFSNVQKSYNKQEQKRFSYLSDLKNNKNFKYLISLDNCLFKSNDIINKEKEIQNINPFNSTAKRQLTSIIGQGTGVGSYGTTIDKWNKKSYNVLFH